LVRVGSAAQDITKVEILSAVFESGGSVYAMFIPEVVSKGAIAACDARRVSCGCGCLILSLFMPDILMLCLPIFCCFIDGLGVFCYTL